MISINYKRHQILKLLSKQKGHKLQLSVVRANVGWSEFQHNQIFVDLLKNKEVEVNDIINFINPSTDKTIRVLENGVSSLSNGKYYNVAINRMTKTTLFIVSIIGIVATIISTNLAISESKSKDLLLQKIESMEKCE